MSHITLNIVEPGTPPSPTPIDPGTDPIVPNTGLFTHGIGGTEATIITVSIVAILAIVAAILYYKKKHNKADKINKTTKLANTINALKFKKKLSIPLAALALVVSLGTLAGLLVNAGKSNTNAAEGDTENSLTVTESSEDLTIEVADEPVFAVFPVELTVAEATAAGYTLTAFTEDTDLVSTTDESNVIPMITVDEEALSALTDNTWGLSLVEPEDKDSEVYTALSTDADTPTVIKSIDDYSPTPAEDKTTIYYGFYITPDVPYGTYEGSVINYEAEPNYITNLSFDGNGSDGGTAIEGMTIIAGDTITLPVNTYTRDGYNFTGWNTAADGTGEAYADEAEFTASISETQDITLYAQWEEACPVNTICYKGNNADPTTNMDNVSQYTTESSVGKQVDLLASNFTKTGHGFVGWSTDQNAWDHLIDNNEGNNPTIYGPNQMITVGDLSNKGMNLYAVWAPAETDNNGNLVSLQDWQGCSSLTPTTYSAETGTLTVGKNTITALTDSRDGNIYTVARLADGNCWMTENLRLDNEPELSQQNTHNPSLPLTNNYEEQITSNFLSATSSDWCTSNNVPCYNQSKLNTDNTALTTTSPVLSQDFTDDPHDWDTGNLDDNISSYSNYYNWYSATAGNGVRETTFTVAGDICPAGWILPIGNETSANGSFSHLDSNMGGTGSDQGTTEASNKWRSFPNNFVYSGYWKGLSAYDRGYYGYYWSSTADDKSYAYYLDFYSDYVSPGTNSYGKYNGGSVRCIAPVE